MVRWGTSVSAVKVDRFEDDNVGVTCVRGLVMAAVIAAKRDRGVTRPGGADFYFRGPDFTAQTLISRTKSAVLSPLSPPISRYFGCLFHRVGHVSVNGLYFLALFVRTLC